MTPSSTPAAQQAAPPNAGIGPEPPKSDAPAHTAWIATGAFATISPFVAGIVQSLAGTQATAIAGAVMALFIGLGIYLARTL